MCLFVQNLKYSHNMEEITGIIYRSIKELAPKPSDAVQAMVDGLLEQSKRTDFAIEMTTFGMATKGVCFGCAATCTIQKMIGINFNNETIESRYNTVDKILQTRWTGQPFELDHLGFREFEIAIDNLRKGYVDFLFKFYHVNYNEHELGEKYEKDLLYLTTGSWEEGLPRYQVLADKLRADGL